MGTKRHAKKQQRQAEKRRVRNKTVKSATRTAVKKALAQAAPGAPADSFKDAQRLAYSALDVAGRKGVIHKRAVARRKSRVAKALNKAAAPSA